MKAFTISIVALALVAGAFAQGKERPLWPNGTPGAKGDSARDIPTLTPFPAPAGNNSGSAIVICPGGSYGTLAPHEGQTYAQFLQKHSVNGFVLKYRLGSAGYRHPIMLGDAARALRTVRANAKQWKINPDKIGIMGSSAGGHLASTLLTHFGAGNPQASDPIDRVSSRPSLGILCYPVISMGEFTHRGSRRNLLGDKPVTELLKLLSNELQVTADTPPTFLWHTVEDKAVPVENSMLFAAALQKAGVPFALHVYQKGRHGLGLADKPPFNNTHPWAGDLVFWLKAQGFIAE